MNTLVLGAGYSGLRIARDAKAYGPVCGTRRHESGIEQLREWGITGHILAGSPDSAWLEILARTTHLVISVPPLREEPLNDPMLRILRSLEHARFAALQWIGYLSTIGVYGDHEGRWVDEHTPCNSTQQRSIMRREAEVAWQDLGRKLGVPVAILRLSGIYGPGRNAVQDALQGRARMLIKPGQVFNRIHVDDLATAAVKAAQARLDGILNITDDQPAPPQDVIKFAHKLVGKSLPEAQDFATAEISTMARSFYSENKRVSNEHSKTSLGMVYRYPTYREGLSQLWDGLKDHDKVEKVLD